MPSATADLVLIGGGHAHVEVVRRFGMAPDPSLRLTLISREMLAPYSGMLPGLVARRYRLEETHIDLPVLCRAAGVRFLHAEATGLDLGRRRVLLMGRRHVGFDLLSLDIGSIPAWRNVPGAAEHALAVKPVDRFLEQLAALDRAIAGGAGHRLLVVGAGAGGCELALAFRERYGEAVSLVLCDQATTPLPSHPAAARAAMQRSLQAQRVAFAGGARVEAVHPGRLILADGREMPFDSLIWTTGAAAPAWLGATGLPLDARGFVRVERTLRVEGREDVFAAGDMIAFAGGGLPKAGVYAVRAGPVLADNLHRCFRGRPLVPFRPQRSALALLATGDGGAIASKGPFAAKARWLYGLKDRIDRRWMAMYQEMRAMPPAMSAAEDDAMRCAGCAAKVGPLVLAEALADQASPAAADILLGLEAPDDAAVIALRPGEAAVQSVDFFPAFIDDPWLFGLIAAVHAMGDLHAMGARPIAGLATAVLPVMAPRLQARDLDALIAGARAALEAEGAVLAGGHSGEGTALSFGLTAIGGAAPEAVIRKRGLQSGDALILTKPIGSGAVFAASMRGRSSGPAIAEALGWMRRSLAPAAQAARQHGARAATDVTGFGLAGHLLEMLRPSMVDAAIDLAALPVQQGALDAFAQGIESTAAPGNRAAAAPYIEIPPDADPSLLASLFDPQTAGGLLFGVPAGAAPACLAALRGTAWMIGRVLPRRDIDAMIRLG